MSTNNVVASELLEVFILSVVDPIFATEEYLDVYINLDIQDAYILQTFYPIYIN